MDGSAAASLLVIFGFLLISSSVADKGIAEVQIRGLNPDLAHSYTGAGGKFTCLDGSKTIPFKRVNDNYCDCADGSDEPGTSACPNGRFYCRNRGHEPKLLSASFVDDGVCDCCDGSDELSGCPYRCLEKSAEQRKALQDAADRYAKALKKKAQYIQDAKAKRADWAARAATIDAEIETQKRLIDSIQEEKAKAEQEEAEASRKAAEEAANAAQQAEQQQQEQDAEARKLQQEQQQDDEPLVGEFHETPEEMGRRIASQWTHDPESALPEDSEDALTDQEDIPAAAPQVHQNYVHPSYGDLSFGAFLGVVSKYFQQLGGWFSRIWEHGLADDIRARRRRAAARGRSSGLQQQQQWQRDPNSPVNQATYKLHAAERDLKQLEKVKHEIELYSNGNLDFGPEDVFLPLAGRCISEHGARWTYEACFFEKATQSEPHQHHSKVNIGNWQGFFQNYTVAFFREGDYCGGQPPQRSFTLHLRCDEHEQMWDAGEPSTCTYSAYMSTPGACTEAELAGIREQLRQLELLEQEILAEVGRHAAAPVKDEL